MSNYLSIAAVTATLKRLLDERLTDDENLPPQIEVSTLPLDKAATKAAENNANQVNIFLFQVIPNPALRNMGGSAFAPARNGGSVIIAHMPPVALELQYLITVYGENDDEDREDYSRHRSQRLLGRVISIFHDNAVLDRAAIKNYLPNSNLHQQVEGLRITPEPLSVDDFTKIWNTFQTGYRLSVAYRIGVVQIDSSLNPRAPLPVLKRGREDRGVYVVGSTIPSLTGISLPHNKLYAEFGDIVTLYGNHLDNEGLSINLQHPLSGVPLVSLPVAEKSANKLKFQLPVGDESHPDYIATLPSTWAVGVYSLSLCVSHPELPEPRCTNAVHFTLLPEIVSVTPKQAPAGNISLTITCKPQIRQGQAVSLLFGDRMIPAQSVSTPNSTTALSTVSFGITDAKASDILYRIRLRIDGVDSLPVIFSENEPPRFDDNQQVRIV